MVFGWLTSSEDRASWNVSVYQGIQLSSFISMCTLLCFENIGAEGQHLLDLSSLWIC